MWIEFLGGVGSGKSSLATALKERFKLTKFPVNSPQEALDIRLTRYFPKVVLHGRLGHAARRTLLSGYQARFSLKHPKLVWQAWNASQKLRNLPGWHRKIIFSLFFEVAGWYEAVSYKIPPKSMVIVDEGLAHRSINLFAWQNGDLDSNEIQAYIENLPEIPLTILVSAPVQVCLERAYHRGLPVRLRGKDPQTIRHFVENSHTVASLAGKILTSNGRSVIKIDNSLGLEQSMATLGRQITETPMFQKYFTKQYQTAFS
jgi:thymidylate kinase